MHSLWIGKPTRVGNYWHTNDKSILCWYDNFDKFSLNINDYNDLTWEDEPVEADLVIKGIKL